MHLGCYYATALDIEVDLQRCRFGSRKSDFALQGNVLRENEGASTDIYIPHLFGPGTSVFVPGFQWSGYSKSGIHERSFIETIGSTGTGHNPPLTRDPQGWVTEKKETRTLTYHRTKRAHINT